MSLRTVFVCAWGAGGSANSTATQKLTKTEHRLRVRHNRALGCNPFNKTDLEQHLFPWVRPTLTLRHPTVTTQGYQRTCISRLSAEMLLFSALLTTACTGRC